MPETSKPMTVVLTRRQLVAITGLAAACALTRTVVAGAVAPKPADAAETVRTKDKVINVAIVLGQHNTLIDVAGPWEVLSSGAYSGGAFNVYSVAAARSPVICDDGRGAMDPKMGAFPLSGLTVIPDFTFDSAPQPRVIVIGAQTSDESWERTSLEWIRRAAAKAEMTASVCTGAYLLAKSGLLDGKRATTNRAAYDDFEKTFPRIKLVRGVRFVDAGSVASATGLTAGIDLALHIVERFYGRQIAQAVANYEEWSSEAWIGS
jgi:transcriptional regulator GlxA family with amidase domain